MCDRDLHRSLHLLEGAHLDLPHALARDAELGGQVLERARVLREATPLEDAPLAPAEYGERFGKRLLAVLGLLALSDARFLVGRAFVDEPVLPLAGIRIIAHLRVERDIAAEPPVHLDDILLGD